MVCFKLWESSAAKKNVITRRFLAPDADPSWSDIPYAIHRPSAIIFVVSPCTLIRQPAERELVMLVTDMAKSTQVEA